MRFRTHLPLLSAALAAAAVALPATPAVAATAYTWTGGDAAGHAWSDGLNWQGGAAPSGSVGDLSFPALSGGSFTSVDDVTPLDAQGLLIADDQPYAISGSQTLDLGPSGITAQPSGAAGGQSARLSLPVALDGDQTWTVTGGQLGYSGNVTGSGSLQLDLEQGGQLSVGSGSDFEVGPLTLTGTGLMSLASGTLDATNANPVTLDPGTNFLVDTAGNVGPLTAAGSLTLGQPGYPATVSVNGLAVLPQTTTITMYIDGPAGAGGTPGPAPASSLAATGDVILSNGPALQLIQTPAGSGTACQSLHPGDVYTLLSASGTLSGTFAGLPDSSTVAVTPGCTGQSQPVNAEINYTSTAVTATILGAIPSLRSAPQISGTAAVGQTLTASPGTWSQLPTSYSYQWEDCDNQGAGCTPISGANGSTYAVGSSDVGSTIEVQVTATNGQGSSTPASSAPTGVVPAPTGPPPSQQPPAIVTRPSISGVAREGQTLTATTGTWSPAPTSYSYRWLDCSTSGSPCTAISGATGTQLTLTSRDVGSTVVVLVTAAIGSSSGQPAASAPTSVVAAASSQPVRPASTAPPTITGTPSVGSKLTATPGAWSGTPVAYAFQWQRCTSSCVNIPDAESVSYRPVLADTGARLRVRVTASDIAGAASATSDETAPVASGVSWTSAGVKRALARLLGTRCPLAKLRRSGCTATFVAPLPGTLHLVWQLASRGRRINIGSVNARAGRAGTLRLTIRLNAAGRRAIRGARRVRVAARASFAPRGARAISATRISTLS